jgi:hypothetical protein
MPSEPVPAAIAKQINMLNAETLALQTVLVSVLYRLSGLGPAFEGPIRSGFDDAARFLEARTIEAGSAVPPEHLAHSLRIVEELRAVALINHEKPKHSV